MTRKLKEEDFEVLRGPFESGRQSPGALSGALILSIFLQGLLFALEYFMAGSYTVYPYKDQILLIHFIGTVILSVLSLIYSMPIVYTKSEKTQYFLSILVSQNLFSISFLICALFIIGYAGEEKVADAGSLLQFTYIILGIGLIIFVVTFIRFFILLKKGHYRKGTKKDALRSRFETTSYVPTTIIGSLGLIFIIQYIVRTSAINELDKIIFIVIGIGLFFVMLFILPEQLVILYCKIRFKSFNFNERGYLNK
ncbi:ABC transporter ATPase [Bacillus sp. FJAT-22090]|uniref:ABC transporter ATPase n=1 Tax=Bacillus sp. FJAT-22090 TaxID=1581038 RepID=UPI00119F4AFE|nr:ABC transporter ATPase [Bacillus sp. FJAT-22090]